MKRNHTHSHLNRHGLSSMVVIGFLAVLFILFSHMVLLMKQEAYMASHFHKRGILANIADAGAACALNALDLLLADPSSDLFKQLADPKTVVEGKTEDLDVIQIYPGGKYNLASLDEILAAYKPLPITLDVKAQIRYLRRFENPYRNETGDIKATNFDNECTAKEKIGILEVVSTARLNPMQQIVREQREVKVTCNALPVTSRFNLFIEKSFKDGESMKFVDFQDQSATGYPELYPVPDMKEATTTWNRVEVKESGGKSKGGEVLNLANGTTPGSKGWIFMGGGDKPARAIIHALAGGRSDTGDGHFLQPDLYLNPGFPGFFGKVDFPGSSKVQSGRTHAHPIVEYDGTNTPTDNAGFFDSGHCADLADFNKKQNLLLDNWLKINASKDNQGTADSAFASIIRLFGPATGTSDVDANHSYIIMGNVWEAHSMIGAFQFGTKKNLTNPGRWDLTGFFPYMQNLSVFKSMCRMIIESFKGKDLEAIGDIRKFLAARPITAWIQAVEDLRLDPDDRFYVTTTGDWPAFEKEIKWPEVYQQYDEFSSRPCLFPYSRFAGSLAPAHKEAIYQGKETPEKENEWASLLPEKTNSAFMQTTREFDKSLNGFYFPLTYFTDRCTFHFKGDDAVKKFDEYFKDHNPGNTLKLGKFLLVEAARIQIPSVNKIEQGGVICCTGDIDVNKIGHDTGDDKEEGLGQSLLTLISLGGTITVGGEVQASIISLGKPNGKVPTGNVEVKSKLDLKGNIVAGNLDAENISRYGGTLTYNKVLSPEHKLDNSASYRVNDYAYVSNLMPRIFRWEVKAE